MICKFKVSDYSYREFARITIQSFRLQRVAHLAAVQSGRLAVVVSLVLAWLLPGRCRWLAAEVSRAQDTRRQLHRARQRVERRRPPYRDLGGRQEGDGETEGELATESHRSATPGRIHRTGTGEAAVMEMGEAQREWAIESWEPPQRHRRPDPDDAGSRTPRARLREELPLDFRRAAAMARVTVSP